MAKKIRRLYLSKTDRKIAGVSGGLAEYFGVDSTLIRLAWVILAIITAGVPALIGYILAAIIIPEEPEAVNDK